MNSLYGNYRTVKFNDIYPDFDTFEEDYIFYKDNGLDADFKANLTLKTLYLLLSARYGISHISGSSVDYFKLKLFGIIFQYAPTWEKRLDVQKKIRNLTELELTTGSKVIYNHAYNPGTEPATSDLDELPAINEQNTNNYVKNKLEGYSNLIALLETDVTQQFIDKFKKLFLTIVEPELPLWYIEEE